MRLPIAAVEVGITDGISTMEHPAIAHIQPTMADPRRVVGADKNTRSPGWGELVGVQ